MDKALNSSLTNEWYTPPEYINLVTTVLGPINLDPASCEMANRFVLAENYYTVADNGLEQDWYGNVFMNPPYGKKEGGATPWVDKFILSYIAGDIKQGICLINSVTGTKRVQSLMKRGFPICFVDHRIAFIDKYGVRQPHPRYNNIFAYLGNDISLFDRVFSSIGSVMRLHNFPVQSALSLYK